MFSPNEQTIASSSASGPGVQLWNASTGQPAVTLVGHNASVLALAFSPDGHRVVSGSDDHTIRVWDAHTGSPLQTLKGHAGGVYAVAFTPDGERVVSGSADKAVGFWSTPADARAEGAGAGAGGALSTAGPTAGPRLWTEKLHIGAVHTAAFSPDGELLAASSALGEDCNLQVYYKTGQPVHALCRQCTASSIAFSADGHLIVAAIRDSGWAAVRVWNASTGHPLHTLAERTGDGARPDVVALSEDGGLLATGSDDGAVDVWNVTSGRRLHGPLYHHRAPGADAQVIRAIAVSPDGAYIVSCSRSHVTLWERAAGTPLRTLCSCRCEGPSSALAVSPDSRHVACASTDGFEVWSRDSEIEDAAAAAAGCTPYSESASVYVLAFSPDSRRILAVISTQNSHTFRVWPGPQSHREGPGALDTTVSDRLGGWRAASFVAGHVLAVSQAGDVWVWQAAALEPVSTDTPAMPLAPAAGSSYPNIDTGRIANPGFDLTPGVTDSSSRIPTPSPSPEPRLGQAAPSQPTTDATTATADHSRDSAPGSIPRDSQSQSPIRGAASCGEQLGCLAWHFGECDATGQRPVCMTRSAAPECCGSPPDPTGPGCRSAAAGVEALQTEAWHKELCDAVEGGARVAFPVADREGCAAATGVRGILTSAGPSTGRCVVPGAGAWACNWTLETPPCPLPSVVAAALALPHCPGAAPAGLAGARAALELRPGGACAHSLGLGAGSTLLRRRSVHVAVARAPHGRLVLHLHPGCAPDSAPCTRRLGSGAGSWQQQLLPLAEAPNPRLVLVYSPASGPRAAAAPVAVDVTLVCTPSPMLLVVLSLVSLSLVAAAFRWCLRTRLHRGGPAPALPSRFANPGLQRVLCAAAGAMAAGLVPCGAALATSHPQALSPPLLLAGAGAASAGAAVLALAALWGLRDPEPHDCVACNRPVSRWWFVGAYLPCDMAADGFRKAHARCVECRVCKRPVIAPWAEVQRRPYHEDCHQAQRKLRKKKLRQKRLSKFENLQVDPEAVSPLTPPSPLTPSTPVRTHFPSGRSPKRASSAPHPFYFSSDSGSPRGLSKRKVSNPPKDVCGPQTPMTPKTPNTPKSRGAHWNAV